MKIWNPILICMISLVCCTNKTKEWSDGTKLLNYGYFTIEVPVGWKQVYTKSIDSYTGEIQIDSVTTLSFDLGWYSNSLDEDKEREHYMIEEGKVYLADTTKKRDPRTSYWTYYAKADSGVLQKLRRNTIQITTIDKHKAKLVIAKNSRFGTTGVYIDSLWKAGSDNDRFQLNGHDLSKEKQQEVLTAIKTLKFYKNPLPLKN